MMGLYTQATATTSRALHQPTKWLNTYSDFIIKNASAVSQIEGALRTLTYIVPGRFRESEIASESLHTFIQLLSLYHDRLLHAALLRLPPHLQTAASTSTSSSPTGTSNHARYTRFWASHSISYRRLALTLQTIQYTELLIEMLARRRGPAVRWRVVVVLELVKAGLRLALLRITNWRPLLNPPLPEREVDPAVVEERALAAERAAKGLGPKDSDEEVLARLAKDDGSFPPVPELDMHQSSATAADDAENWTMPRTGLSMPSLPDPSDISGYLLSKVLTADDIKPAKALLRRVRGKGELAEVLYVLRPVVYALALQRWQGEGKKSWRPWLIGLSMEFGARQLAKRDLQDRIAGGLRGLTGLERDELRKRGWALAWWGMRGGFYQGVTSAWIKSVASKLRNKPLLDLVATVIEDYEYLWDEYYFATATL